LPVLNICISIVIKAVEHSDFYLAKLILEAQTDKESKSISKHIKTSQQWFYSKQNIMLEVFE
jgi:predicted NAD-dependent protein-ADP-ribosyltransferase YbiA (DUF1768 family)